MVSRLITSSARSCKQSVLPDTLSVRLNRECGSHHFETQLIFDHNFFKISAALLS